MKIFNLFFCVYFLTSCSKQINPPTNIFNPFEIKKIGIIQPFVNVEVLGAKNEEKSLVNDYTAEITENSTKAIESFLIGNGLNAERVALISISESEILKKEIEHFFKILSNDGKIFPIDRANDDVQKIVRELKVSNEFIQILKKRNLPYAISTLTFGFTRTLRGQRNRNIAIVANTLFSLPSFFFTFKYIKNSNKFYSTTYFLLVDIEGQKIVMYNAKEKQIDPTLEVPLRSQIFEGLYEYWSRDYKLKYIEKNKQNK
jgi:hypothetical protein